MPHYYKSIVLCSYKLIMPRKFKYILLIHCNAFIYNNLCDSRAGPGNGEDSLLQESVAFGEGQKAYEGSRTGLWNSMSLAKQNPEGAVFTYSCLGKTLRTPGPGRSYAS
jgi:hypothetical protein